MNDDKFVQPSALDGQVGKVVACNIVEKPDVRKVNGVFIPTGRKSLRTALYFADGTMTRTKSQHFARVFGYFCDKPYTDAGGDKGAQSGPMDEEFEFFMTSTEYANGEVYDVIDARRVQQDLSDL